MARRKLQERSIAITLSVLFALVLCAGNADAGSSWSGIRAEVYGTRAIHNGTGIIALKAPDRPEDQRAVPISVEAALTDGRTIKTVSVIVDENPSPVAAVFRFGPDRNRVFLAAKYRLNAGTDVRAVVETSDGQLYMVERHVKFAGGQAACSAPPSGDPQEVAANMGKMNLATADAAKVAATGIQPRVRLDVRHPNHTGMVLDQITLLYTPLRMVNRIEVTQGHEPVFEMDGSITLAEDPSIEFDYRVNGVEELQVVVKDTEGAVWQQQFPISHGS